jgi:hypothetical protein
LVPRYRGSLQGIAQYRLADVVAPEFTGCMKITRQMVVFDTADLAGESSFWASILGGTVDAEPDWHTVRVDGEARIAFQLAPDHVQPDWPDGAPQQVHLDLYVDDIRSAHDEAIAAGARPLTALVDFDSEDGFQVYADPSGHPFCLCWG